MPGSRHFFSKQSADQTRAEIADDIRNSRKAQRDLEATGQHGPANMMAEAVDEHLDELSRVNNGTWKPDFA
ncbi:hypothetical protein ACWHA3_02190 [Streptomyces cyaneofuscatus]